LQVSASGSVKVEKLMEVERYSHVMHISSTGAVHARYIYSTAYTYSEAALQKLCGETTRLWFSITQCLQPHTLPGHVASVAAAGRGVLLRVSRSLLM
jgi:hypothetical protein